MPEKGSDRKNVRPIPYFLKDLAILQAAQPAHAQNVKEILNVWAWQGQSARLRMINQLPALGAGNFFRPVGKSVSNVDIFEC